MSSELSVPRVGAPAAAGEVARAHGSGTAGKPTGHAAGDRTGEHPAAGKALPNPTLRLDPGLAIVVIEFRDETGAVRSTIPTEQQLDAYRTWDRTHATAAAAPTAHGDAPQDHAPVAAVKASTTGAG